MALGMYGCRNASWLILVLSLILAAFLGECRVLGDGVTQATDDGKSQEVCLEDKTPDGL